MDQYTPETQNSTQQTDVYDQQSRRPNPRRRKKQLAPWEKALRKYWPPIRLVMLGAIAILLIVLLISCAISAFV